MTENEMNNQAAQTMHPDALPDGTLSKSTAKRVDALAAASVSERAREWFDAYDNAVSDLFADEETGWNEGNRRHWMRRRIDRLRSILIAALEQALTQQQDAQFLATVIDARQTWINENPGEDGRDQVTPFDKFLYGTPQTAPLCEECGIELGERIGALVVKS